MKQSGRKTGSLSAGTKAPPSAMGGLDWDALRKRRAERLEEEWDRGIRNADTIRHRWLSTLTDRERQAEDQRVAEGRPSEVLVGEDGEPYATGQQARKTAPAKTDRVKRNRSGPRYDVDRMVELYVEKGMAPKEIAEEMSISSDTAIKWLKKRGVFDPKRHLGKARRPKNSYTRYQNCPRCGIDMTVPGNAKERTKPNGASNGWECIPCSRERHRRNYWANKNKSN